MIAPLLATALIAWKLLMLVFPLDLRKESIRMVTEDAGVAQG